MAIDAHVHRFSTAEYERMVNSGVLGELRVELIDGLVTIVPGRSETGERSPARAQRR